MSIDSHYIIGMEDLPSIPIPLDLNNKCPYFPLPNLCSEEPWNDGRLKWNLRSCRKIDTQWIIVFAETRMVETLGYTMN